MMAVKLVLAIAGVAVCAAIVPAGDAAFPFPIPDDMSKFLGDPNRGPEPDPAQHKGRYMPPLAPVVCNQGHPIRDEGHFRLKHSVVSAFQLPADMQTIEAQKAARSMFELKTWKDGSQIRYSVLAPPADAQRPANGWPVVISCPGVGGIGKTELEVKKGGTGQAVVWGLPYYREHFPCYVVQFHPMGRTVEYHDAESKDGPGTVEPTVVLDAYLELVDFLLETEPIDKSRVYLLGFSMGGSSVWQMLAKRPDLFAAAAPAAGGPRIDDNAVAALKETPIWMFMGNQDPWSGSAYYILMYQKLQKAGAPKVRFWEIQDMAHSHAPLLMVPLAEWLFAQKR